MSGLKATVLVTGATGFIGSHLCRRLTEQGATVHAVCRAHSPVPSTASRTWKADLGDANTVASLVRAVSPDYVFHLAAITSASRDVAAVLPTFRANLVNTVNVLSAIAEVGCQRVVLAGSLEEPDDRASVPSSPYAASKWAASGYARMFWQLYKTPAAVARIFMVYGPAQRDTKKLIPSTILSLLRGTRPEISSGRREVDWIFVSDVVDGLLALSQAPNVDGLVVDLGTGVLTSVREVVQTLANEIAPAIQLEFGGVPDRPLEQVRTADLNRSAKLLSWSPSVKLQDGLRRTVDYFRQRPELYRP